MTSEQPTVTSCSTCFEEEASERNLAEWPSRVQDLFSGRFRSLVTLKIIFVEYNYSGEMMHFLYTRLWYLFEVTGKLFKFSWN